MAASILCVFATLLWLGPYLSYAQNVEEQCAKARGGLVAHDKFCDFYYRCDKNGDKPVLEQCPNGLVFSGFRRGLMSNCDYPHRVDCGDKSMGQQPLNAGACEWAFGIFAHDTSCTRYWQCWNGTATLQMCPFSLLYNDKLRACDWADNVPDCQKHPLCKDVPNGAVPIEKSCTRYWLCVGGYPRISRCSAGLAFDRELFKCSIATEVPGCEPPPAPVTNDVDGGNNGTSEANRDNILA